MSLDRQQTELFRVNRFHNSTMERDEKKLGVYEAAAKAQDDQILGVMSKGGEWSADDLQGKFPAILLTSIRRALTNLSKGGYIELSGKKKGKYDRNVLVWKFKSPTK